MAVVAWKQSLLLREFGRQFRVDFCPTWTDQCPLTPPVQSRTGSCHFQPFA